MASITVPESLTGQAGLNRWDSPWPNTKFVSGLVMVLAVLLMGLVGGRFWNERPAWVVSDPQFTGQPRPTTPWAPKAMDATFSPSSSPARPLLPGRPDCGWHW